MKCDELKVYVPQDGPWGLEPEEGGKLVEEETCYLKSEVDAAIDELKTAHHKERHEYISMVHSREQTIKELKQKLHDAEMRADLAEAAETERKIDYKELKERLRWRKYPEEEPETEGDYLVMALYPDDDKLHIEICLYDRNCEDFGHYERRYAGSGDYFGGFDGEEWVSHNVAFWMLLPKAPKEAK